MSADLEFENLVKLYYRDLSVWLEFDWKRSWRG